MASISATQRPAPDNCQPGSRASREGAKPPDSGLRRARARRLWKSFPISEWAETIRNTSSSETWKRSALRDATSTFADLRRARVSLLIRARPFFQVLLGLPPRLRGFMGFGLVMRTAGAMRTASVYDSRSAPASGVRGGSKCSTCCRTLRHRMGVVLLLGWRRLLRWRLLLRWRRLLRWWWCLR